MSMYVIRNDWQVGKLPDRDVVDGTFHGKMTRTIRRRPDRCDAFLLYGSRANRIILSEEKVTRSSFYVHINPEFFPCHPLFLTLRISLSDTDNKHTCNNM